MNDSKTHIDNIIDDIRCLYPTRKIEFILIPTEFWDKFCLQNPFLPGRTNDKVDYDGIKILSYYKIRNNNIFFCTGS